MFGNEVWLITPQHEPPGMTMAVFVWVCVAYLGTTIALLADSGHLWSLLAYVHGGICAMAPASHAETMPMDPGSKIHSLKLRIIVDFYY